MEQLGTKVMPAFPTQIVETVAGGAGSVIFERGSKEPGRIMREIDA